MITKWKLFNFKSVRQETELELGPLTIFAGPNSGGKSTLIQSMLLVSQTLSSKVSSRSVVLNGHLIKLGQFDDLRSFKSEASQILLGWECHPQTDRSSLMGRDVSDVGREEVVFHDVRTDRLKSVYCEISFDVDPSSPNRDLMQLQPRLFGCTIFCLTRTDENLDSKSKIVISLAGEHSNEPADKIRNLRITSIDNEHLRFSLNYDVELDDDSLKELHDALASAKPVGCVFRHFLPDRISIRYDKTEEEARQITMAICDQRARFLRRRTYERAIISSNVIDLLKERLKGLVEPILEKMIGQEALFAENTYPILTVRDWYEWLGRLPIAKRHEIRLRTQEISDEIKKAVMAEKDVEYSLSSYRVPEDIAYAMSYLDSLFSNSVKYLGPLREEPKALYPLAATVDPLDVGLHGEYTAAVLDLYKNRLIRYIPTVSFKPSNVKKDETSLRSLESAVLDWLQYMGVAEKVQTIDRGKLGHELKIMTSEKDEPHDLTHVGVGVSQVLPILVTCLLAEKDTTLIVEQPELHLHPRVQTLLADFFLSMALLGKQCVVETHSEYIINRLRFRAASALDDTISSLIKIYFVEKKDNVSSFREVVVNKYGAIADWPEGFFDQSQAEAEEILRAATIKRKKERGDNKNAERND